MVHIHRQMRERIEQHPAELAGELHRGHRKGLVAAPGHHLEGLGLPSSSARYSFATRADPVKLLLTDRRPGERRDAEDLLHPAVDLIHIDPVVLRLDIDGALGVVDLKLPRPESRLRMVFIAATSKVLRLSPFRAISPWYAIISSFMLSSFLLSAPLQCCQPLVEPWSSAVISSSDVLSQKLTRSAPSIRAAGSFIAIRVWLAAPLEQADPLET